jgi:hypothetical protein
MFREIQPGRPIGIGSAFGDGAGDDEERAMTRMFMITALLLAAISWTASNPSMAETSAWTDSANEQPLIDDDGVIMRGNCKKEYCD